MYMLSKSEIKWISSLKNKKYRYIHKAFIAEGTKLVNDLLQSKAKVIKIYTTQPELINFNDSEKLLQIDEKSLKKISCLQHPNSVLAVFEMDDLSLKKEAKAGEWLFTLDGVRDPGNLGTILRTLDWFGFDRLICSNDVVDIYNPKVVQASMGSIARVKAQYGDLSLFLTQQKVPVYSTLMDGEPINQSTLTPGIVVFGNEGKGISEQVQAIANQSISIPKIGSGESLNVAISVSVIASFLKLSA